jgi:hypothetical protein
MEVVERVRSIDLLGHAHEVKKAEMEIHYRSVPHFQTHIAVSARLKGRPSSKEEINEKLKAYSNKRWTSQPAAPSAGCIFKNPGPVPAGKLIDEMGTEESFGRFRARLGSAREFHRERRGRDGGGCVAAHRPDPKPGPRSTPDRTAHRGHRAGGGKLG